MKTGNRCLFCLDYISVPQSSPKTYYQTEDWIGGSKGEDKWRNQIREATWNHLGRKPP
jgi:hypothetical protein